MSSEGFRIIDGFQSFTEMFPEEFIEKGDLPGHPFRGNQYTDGIPGVTPSEAGAESHGEWTEYPRLLRTGLTKRQAEDANEAVAAYVNGNNRNINVELKNGHWTKHAKGLLLYMAATKPLPSDRPVYRGYGMRPEQYDSLEEGGEIEAPNFWSTSQERNTARDFAIDWGHGKKHPVIFDIVKHRSAVPLGAYSLMGEYEALFRPGTRFRITSIEKPSAEREPTRVTLEEL